MVRNVMPALVQSGDTVIIGDHKWVVKYLSEPDHIGSVDAALVDSTGHEKWASMLDAVTIEV